jgi:hypothetical protein
VVIEGNYIGVGADGSTPLGNRHGFGALGRDVPPVPAPDDGFVVGGTAAGAGNRIAHNTADGIMIGGTTGGVTVLGNEIFANGERGIDFGDDGVSANGSRDPEVLPPFPVLTNVDVTGAGTLVQGTIDFPRGRDVRIEFFSSPACDPSGHGEGQTPIGVLAVTGSGGPAAFAARLAATPAGHVITATVTDLTQHRTSEFSRCAVQSTAPPAPGGDPGGPPPGPGPGPEPGGQPGPAGTPGGTGDPTPPDVPPPSPPCEVPKLTGLTPAKAKRRLKGAGCKVGKVKKPRRPRGRGYRLVVRRSGKKPGSTHPPRTAVGLTLKWVRTKPRRR